MKKRTVLLVLLVLLVLSGCGQGGLAARSAETAQEEADFSSTLVEGQARPLTEGEIRSAYDRAVNAYGWFDLTPLPTTSQQETVDGWLYQKVDYPGIEDLADLRAYLRVVFSQELTDRLLEQGDHPAYRDVDGALYAAVDISREKARSKGSVEVMVTQESETVYSVEVTVDLLDSASGEVIGVECYAFPYEFIEENWVFTDFQLVY